MVVCSPYVELCANLQLSYFFIKLGLLFVSSLQYFRQFVSSSNMKALPSDWLTRHWGDEELPRYEFLAWLQSLYADMDAGRLFPVWEDGYAEYHVLKETESGLSAAMDMNRGALTGWDLRSMSPVYNREAANGDAELDEMLNRLRFARPLLKKAMQQSLKLRDEWLSAVDFGVWGLHLPNRMEGLLLTVIRPASELWAWQYHTSVQTRPRYPYTAIRTRLLGKYDITLGNGIDRIRRDCLSRCGWEQSVVSTFMAETDHPIPVVYTLKPLAVMRLADEILPV